MELIVNRNAMFHSFSSEWRVKWVPSIMTYCKRLRKKEVTVALATYYDSNSTGLGCENILMLRNNYSSSVLFR